MIKIIGREYKEEYEEKYALIIGISNYKYANSLEYAKNDAEAIKEILIRKFFYKEENIIILLDENATKEKILNAFNDYINNVGKDDSIVFYFAGHGNTKMGIEGNAGFLIPYEGNEINYNSLISWDELIRISNLIIAKHIFFILDACYSGLALTRTASFGRARFMSEILTRNARQVLTAGLSNQTVKDGSGVIPNHSLFTSYLLKALEGEAKNECGVLTANLIMAYVYNKVSNSTYSTQIPKYGYVMGEGDFVFDKGNKKAEEDNKDFMIKIPSPIDEVTTNRNNKTELLKELLGDYKNKIKIHELVNQELKNVVAQLNYCAQHQPKQVTDNNTKQVIEKYNIIIDNICEIVVLLIYYGQEEYIDLVAKIIEKIENKKQNSGYKIYNDLCNYPCFIVYYYSIIAALESRNKDILKKIINIKNNYPNYMDSEFTLERVTILMNEIHKDFKCCFKEGDYAYPMNEYIYKIIQPTLDDILFMGDGYEETYLNTELLISLFQASLNYYFNNNQVWGAVGRYKYRFRDNFKIEHMPIYEIAKEIGIFEKIKENERDFINKYNTFVKSYFI